MGFQRVGKIVNVDDDIPNSRRAQAVEDVIEQRLAAHLHQWLRPRCGERAHALAEAGGHDHRGMRYLYRHLGAQTEGFERAWVTRRRATAHCDGPIRY